MFAGVDNASAEDAWYETALKIENNYLRNVKFVGTAADIYKCFDQIARPLLYKVAAVAGMPVGVLDAHKRYQEGIKMHNTLAA